MVRDALVWLLGLGVLFVSTVSEAGERPLAETIRAAADAVRPAVVGIEVKGRRGPEAPQAAPGAPQWPFRWPPRPGEPRQWRWEFHWPPRDDQPQEDIPDIIPIPEGQFPFMPFRRPPAEGTGLLLEVEGERGLVAAPHSLLAGAETVFVRLADGRQLAAKLLGSDAVTGIGCLEVRGPKLTSAKLANPQAVQVGDWVIAVGGPASGDAITLGIVSTTKRGGEGEMAGTRLVLADLTLAEGMAGGPLVTANGEVVGLTIGPARRRPAQRDLAAAVPADTAQEAIRALAKEGKVRRGWLGVMLRPLDPEAMKQLNIEAGIQVAQALDGQPAAKAGVQGGDVITEIDGRKATDVETFRGLVSAKRPGTRVALKVLRAGKEMTIEVTLGEQTGEGAGAPAMPAGGEKLDIGLSLQPLTPDLAGQFGLEGEKGLLVTDVADGSPAAKARPAPIARGDLLKEIARKPVATLAEAKAAIEEARKANEKSLLLLVRGKEGTRYVVVDLPR